MTKLGENTGSLDAIFYADATTASHEASEQLLEEGEDYTGEERPRTGRFRASLRTYGSQWLCFISLTCTLLFVTTVILNAGARLFPNRKAIFFQEPQENIGQDADEEMLGIRLHPEIHENRVPQTITHHWEITSDFRSPDGVRKEVYLVNGLFPGPTIECRSGDRLVIHVTNSFSSGEGISIHWHGLDMRGSNEMDGVSGFTQCPILSGKTFIYDFHIGDDQTGTFWWHAHSQVLRGDGMYGGLVVHKPKVHGDDREFYGYRDDILVMIGDWYHRSAEEVLQWYTSVRGFGNEPVPDSLLVNGVGRFICSMAVPARPVECVDVLEGRLAGLLDLQTFSTSTRLRIVNTGSLAGFTLQVSSAKLTPITVDGGFPISGSAADSVGILYPGERADLILGWDKLSELSSPKLTIALDSENFKYSNPALRQNQSFPMFSQNTDSFSKSDVEDQLSQFDLSTVLATTNFRVPQAADQTILLYAKTEKLSIDNNIPTGYMNRTSWSPQSSPPFPLLSLPRSQWNSHQLVPYVPTSPNSRPWIDIIINNLDDGSHPFHLHGNSFYVLASYRSEHGWGSYNPFSGTSTGYEANLVNPVRKDTVSVPRRGFVVIRFKADNEGIWMLHCHVLFHQASGMAMGFHAGSDEGHERVNSRARELCPSLPQW